jgi:hypothetical protein
MLAALRVYGDSTVDFHRNPPPADSRGHDTLLWWQGPCTNVPCDPSSVGFNVSLSSRKLFSFTIEAYLYNPQEAPFMLAIRFEAFGDPSVLKLVEAAVPSADQGMALVRIMAASINPSAAGATGRIVLWPREDARGR